MKLWYLGSPYSRYRHGPDKAYERISHQAAILLKAGVNVFSPIAHSHSLASHGDLDPVDHELWMKADKPYMDKCDGLVVCMMEGWDESKGINHEIEYFTTTGKPVVYMSFLGSIPYELTACEPAASSVTTNPKDIIGRTKPPLSMIPGVAEVHESLAMRYGAGRYGAWNWRQKEIAASVYIDALKRHVQAWFDGEDNDPESKIHHLGHARACLGILLDAESIGKLVDDRPTPGGTGAAIRKFTEKKA